MATLRLGTRNCALCNEQLQTNRSAVVYACSEEHGVHIECWENHSCATKTTGIPVMCFVCASKRLQSDHPTVIQETSRWTPDDGNAIDQWVRQLRNSTHAPLDMPDIVENGVFVVQCCEKGIPMARGANGTLEPFKTAQCTPEEYVHALQNAQCRVGSLREAFSSADGVPHTHNVAGKFMVDSNDRHFMNVLAAVEKPVPASELLALGYDFAKIRGAINRVLQEDFTLEHVFALLGHTVADCCTLGATWEDLVEAGLKQKAHLCGPDEFAPVAGYVSTLANLRPIMPYSIIVRDLFDDKLHLMFASPFTCQDLLTMQCTPSNLLRDRHISSEGVAPWSALRNRMSVHDFHHVWGWSVLDVGKLAGAVVTSEKVISKSTRITLFFTSIMGWSKVDVCEAYPGLFKSSTRRVSGK